MAFGAVSRNLAVYLNVVLHQSNTANAANVSMWGGTCYFTPLLGAAIADTYWGNYRTILISVLIYLSGMATITTSSLAPSLKPSPCDAATPVQNLVFFSGMYLIAIGSGGIKSALLPLGADQFHEEDPTEREKKGHFFSHFYISNTIGLLASGTFIVWIEDNISWALGLGVATSCLGLAFLAFVAGTPSYCLRMPRGSPLKSILQFLVASLRKASTEVPMDESRLYEEEAIDESSDNSRQQRLAHTQEFRCLDNAATIMDSEF